MKAQSEIFRSYFDTTLGYVFFNVPAAAMPEIRQQLDSARRGRKRSEEERRKFIDLLMAWVRLWHYPLLAHEWGHALQALTHPTLFLRCLREFSAICTIVDELRKVPEPVPLPLVPTLNWSAELAVPTVPVRLSIGVDGEPDAEDPTGKPMPGDISETDLLEGSNSIFQYKAEIGSEGSEHGYQRWLKEGRKHVYRKAFDFAASALSPADAYTALPPLVMAAYATTWPVHSFVSLLALTVRAAPAPPSEMGVDRYWRFLELALEHLLETGTEPEPRRSRQEEEEQRRIAGGDVIGMARGMPAHPLSAIVELAWSNDASIGRLREAILHPYLAFSRRHRDAEEWLEPFRPAVTAFRMLDVGMEVSETPVYISPTVVSGRYQPDGMNWQEFLVELMRMKAFVFASATPFLRDLPHNCPHTTCQYHRFDMCRAWAHIPVSAEKCGFPEWLASSTLRSLDLNHKLLVPID